uniref:Uncharacterized protein n=1 Tax=Steinernema glaseri TaxID=37863 RepID=A0A1I8A1E2_9BILA
MLITEEQVKMQFIAVCRIDFSLTSGVPRSSKDGGSPAAGCYSEDRTFPTAILIETFENHGPIPPRDKKNR